MTTYELLTMPRGLLRVTCGNTRGNANRLFQAMLTYCLDRARDRDIEECLDDLVFALRDIDKEIAEED